MNRKIHILFAFVIVSLVLVGCGNNSPTKMQQQNDQSNLVVQASNNEITKSAEAVTTTATISTTIPSPSDSIIENAKTQTIGGISGNMMNNGLADGVGEIIVYSWENQLIKVNTDGTHRQILSDDEAQCICIYGDWIYYRKVGATSDPINGMYKIKKDGSQRTQITSDTTQNIYVVGDWIYYVNWSYSTDICRIKTDGTSRETLYVGQYDCLSTDGEYLYFVDFGKDVYIKAPLNGGTYEVIIPCVFGMPQVCDGWIYYEDGIDYMCYRIRTDGTRKESYETTRISDYFLATEKYNFFGWSRVDNNTGETSKFFTEDDYDRWIVGNKILYIEMIYDPNNESQYQNLTSQTLLIKDINGGVPIVLERKTYDYQ